MPATMATSALFAFFSLFWLTLLLLHAAALLAAAITCHYGFISDYWCHDDMRIAADTRYWWYIRYASVVAITLMMLHYTLPLRWWIYDREEIRYVYRHITRYYYITICYVDYQSRPPRFAAADYDDIFTEHCHGRVAMPWWFITAIITKVLLFTFRMPPVVIFATMLSRFRLFQNIFRATLRLMLIFRHYFHITPMLLITLPISYVEILLRWYCWYWWDATPTVAAY